MTYRNLYVRRQLTMWLDLSTHCNAACPQCHRTNPDGLGKADFLDLVQWSLEEFKKYFPVETMSHIRKFDICGTWGDPMMNKDIFQICEYIIKNSDCRISIHTNGSLRNEEWWWNLAVMCGRRLDVTFTVDGSTQDIHSMYRQNTDLATILSNMETLVMGGSHASVFTVIFKHNQDDLLNITKLAKDYGASEIVFTASNRFHRSGQQDFNFKKEGTMYKLHKTTLPQNIIDEINFKGFNLHHVGVIEKLRDLLNG